ncbi:MAG TPA: DUF362 domain-containing protein [Geobacteraceae bacterium]|nr:DUF362 domain-containing protein [Geobacteraceae bacterium]
MERAEKGYGDKYPVERTVLAGVSRGASERDIKLAVRLAAEMATDFSWLSKGDAVFIKPAHNSGNPYPATTSPVAVGAMVELLKEKGAGRVIVGDMAGIEHVKLSPDGLAGSTRLLMESSGMAGAALAAGAELSFFDEAGWDAFFEDFPTAGSSWKRGLMMPNILREVEHIVLMPRCGSHALAGSTLGLKASVGYWRTDTRLEFHRDASTLQEKIAEGNTVEALLKKQRMVISAADRILTTCGPDKGHVSEPENGIVIASESVVAHDMVSLAWFLENRRNAPAWKKMFLDPYSYQLSVGIGNRWIAGKLGGWGPALASQTLSRNDLDTIWDDRVLNHAYLVLGGMPSVALEPADDIIPKDVLKSLGESVTPAPTVPSAFIPAFTTEAD